MSSEDEVVDGVIPPQAWGGRYFLAHQSGGKFPTRSPFIFTPTFKEPRFFYIQLRFALDGGVVNLQQGQPALPFQETIMNVGSAIGQVNVTMTRSLTGQAASMDDSYVISGAGTDPRQSIWLPVSIVCAKKLIINIENTGEIDLWLDCTVATLKTLTNEQLLALRWSTSRMQGGGTAEINTYPNCFGFGEVAGTDGNGPTRTAATNVAARLLPGDPTRRQFWVSNESPERLALRFGPHQPDVSAGNESWDVILDAKGGANSRYQSPLDAFWGEVWGVWESGAPTGFALASSAIYLIGQ